MKKGKKICELLKQIRLDIARENGIEYTPNECHHKGDCAGTCPACDNELLYLEREISRKRSFGKVAIIGISMGITTLALTSCSGSEDSLKIHEQYGGYIPSNTAEMTDSINVDPISGLIDNTQGIDESTND